VDVGCGGGILCESLARLGASVTGIEPSLPSITAAKTHASKDRLLPTKPLEYIHTTAEELVKTHNSAFDVVCSLEVIEHVKDVGLFVSSLSGLLKPGGLIFMSTINKTVEAYLLTILFAEYAMGWVDRGTHDWNKYIEPHHLQKLLGDNGIKVIEMKGQQFNPLLPERWCITDGTGVNYFLLGTKHKV